MKIKDLINDSNTTIVDVRTEEEFSHANVRGSINVPLGKVVGMLEELKKMQPLVLCCLSGVRSGKATSYLRAQGCEHVYNGGGWEEVQAQQN